MRKFSLIFLAFVISTIGLNAQKHDVSDLPIPKVEYRGGIYYLELDAETSYERGYQHGKALSFAIQRALRDFNEWLRNNAGIKEPDKMIADFVSTTGHLNSVKSLLPDLYEEMLGISEGAGVDLNQLFLYQAFDELFLFLFKSGALGEMEGHCTTTGVYGRNNLPNYVTHNNDIPTYHEGAVTVLKIKYPDSDLEILQSTFAGQIGQNGVNNKGVGVGMNTLADLPTSDQGIPVSFNVRRILESSNVEEAVEYRKSVHFGTAMNYMIADRDKVVSVETLENNVVVLDTYEGKYAVHSNHTLQKDAPVTFKMDASTGGGSYGFTHERLDIGLEFFKNNETKADYNSIKKLKSTRPILVNPGSPTGRTLMCMIVEIPAKGNPVLYQTPDSPNWFEHVKFEFTSKNP